MAAAVVAALAALLAVVAPEAVAVEVAATANWWRSAARSWARLSWRAVSAASWAC
jgi:hypothetical protein